MPRHEPSDAMWREAQKMAASRIGPGGWHHGRSNRNRRVFWIIASRENKRRVARGEKPIAHWTAKDGTGCTCKGFRDNGVCSHVLAAQIVFDAAAEADGSDGLASPAEVDAAFAGVAADHDAIAEAERHLADARVGSMLSDPGRGTPVTRVPVSGGLRSVEPRRSYDDLFPDDLES